MVGDIYSTWALCKKHDMYGEKRGRKIWCDLCQHEQWEKETKTKWETIGPYIAAILFILSFLQLIGVLDFTVR